MPSATTRKQSFIRGADGGGWGGWGHSLSWSDGGRMAPTTQWHQGNVNGPQWPRVCQETERSGASHRWVVLGPAG